MAKALSNRAYAAELLGSAILLATIIGSGIMAENLAAGNTAVALLGNSIPTGAILVVLITILGPISGAHFNPAVTLVMCLTNRLPWARFVPYILCQIVGAIAGVWCAHAMFDLPIAQVSTKLRWGTGQWVAEFVAAFGLILTIYGGLRFRSDAIPLLVGLYITAAYWFTASTSFANPAVTLSRSFSNTFAGISPASCLPFVGAQIIGALAAALVCTWLFGRRASD